MKFESSHLPPPHTTVKYVRTYIVFAHEKKKKIKTLAYMSHINVIRKHLYFLTHVVSDLGERRYHRSYHPSKVFPGENSRFVPSTIPVLQSSILI